MVKKVTIRDVARKAGVSYQTVSRVMNNRYDVADETRQRVFAAIDELRYRPSLAARMLNREQMMMIATIMPFEPDVLSAHTHLLQILCGVNRVAVLQDYSTLLSVLRSQHDSLFAYRSLLKEHLVDGVIVEGAAGETGAQLLVDRGYFVVVVGYSSQGLNCVHSDDAGGAYGLTQHLIALGHRRIAVINGPAHDIAVQKRVGGYQQALRDAGLSIDPSIVAEGDFSFRSGYTAAAALMQRHEPPTAIFAFNDLMAIGAIRWLHENNYTVPKDISVAGFDDIANAEYFNPPLTTVHQFSYDLGMRSARLLLDLIQGKTKESSEVVLPSHLVVRGSTAALNRW